MIKTISQIQYPKRRSVEIMSTRRSVASTALFANTSQGYSVEYIMLSVQPWSMDHRKQSIRQNIDTNKRDLTITVLHNIV